MHRAAKIRSPTPRHKAPRQPRSTNHDARISRRARAAVISSSSSWGDGPVFGDCLCAPRNTRARNVTGTCAIVRLSSPDIIISNGLAPFGSLVVIMIMLLSAFHVGRVRLTTSSGVIAPLDCRVEPPADPPKDSSVLPRARSEKTSCNRDNLGGAPTESFLEAVPTARTSVRGKCRQVRAHLGSRKMRLCEGVYRRRINTTTNAAGLAATQTAVSCASSANPPYSKRIRRRTKNKNAKFNLHP